MTTMMSACGVLCSGCPAFHGREDGVDQLETAAAWRRIYRLKAKAEDISCGGCQGPEDQLFGSCRKCKARRCCREKGLRSCAECKVGRVPRWRRHKRSGTGCQDSYRPCHARTLRSMSSHTAIIARDWSGHGEHWRKEAVELEQGSRDSGSFRGCQR